MNNAQQPEKSTSRASHLTWSGLQAAAASSAPALIFGTGKEIFRIQPDGSVLLAEGAQPDDAARAFWAAVDWLRPATLSTVKPGGAVHLPGHVPHLRQELLDRAETLERQAAGDRETGESIEQAIEDGEGYTPDEPQDVAAGLSNDADRAEEIAGLLRRAATALAARQSVWQEPEDDEVTERIQRLRDSASWEAVGLDTIVMTVGPKHFDARYVVTFDINENHNGVWVAEWQNESLEPRRVGLFASEEEAKGACVIDAVKEDNDRWVWTGPTIAAPPAQGIDLGQFRVLLQSAAMFYDRGLKGRCRGRIDDALALIDSQLDAAPGVSRG